MCFPLNISQNRNIMLYAAIQENLQGSTQHHPPLCIPLGKGDMNLPEGAGRHSSGDRHFWQSRKLSGAYLATTIILKSDSLSRKRVHQLLLHLLLRIPPQKAEDLGNPRRVGKCKKIDVTCQKHNSTKLHCYWIKDRKRL